MRSPAPPPAPRRIRARQAGSTRATLGALVAALALLGLAERAGAGEPGARFWEHWSDGLAEVSGYRLVQPRYGEPRIGRVVLIYVTEPFSRSRYVKLDGTEGADGEDRLIALKLNVVRRFQTGIYDYALLTSVYTDPADGFAPLAVTFTSQEWCGNTYETQLRGRDGALAVNVFSYFDGENRRTELDDARVRLEDALLIQLRGLARDALATAPWRGPMIGSATTRRLLHQPASPFAGNVTWSAEARSGSVPGGTFRVREATHARQDGSRCTTRVEVPYPHRIVGWSCTDGEEAELLGTERRAYWREHGEGDEALLGTLGLEPMEIAP